MTDKDDLPDDLAAFRDSYVELFGALPALPAARFALSGEVDPEALRCIERLRAHAFYSDVLDVKIEARLEHRSQTRDAAAMTRRWRRVGREERFAQVNLR